MVCLAEDRDDLEDGNVGSLTNYLALFVFESVVAQVSNLERLLERR